MRHTVAIIGGGTAGITVAARLKRRGIRDIVVIEPSDEHWYQPLWTLVGGGLVTSAKTKRPTSSVIPRGVTWIKGSAVSVDPVERSIELQDGGRVDYEWLVVAAGIQLDWQGVKGLPETLGRNGVSSNYRVDLAEYTWQNVRALRSGTALFTMPTGPIKCGGAPQKIAYLACDYWHKQGVLNDIDVHLVLPTPTMFGIKEFADSLAGVVRRYGIKVHFSSELVAIDGETRTATIRSIDTGTESALSFDLVHVVPPQSAPDWIKQSSLADPDHPGRYVKVDKHSLRHPSFPNVFALGDCSSSPNSKTGAAVRKQAPVVVKHLMAAMNGRSETASYDGYSSCPLVTARNKCIMAEFDYDLQRTPTFPLIDATKERRDMFLVKRWLLPILYWRFMLRGRA